MADVDDIDDRPVDDAFVLLALLFDVSSDFFDLFVTELDVDTKLAFALLKPLPPGASID